MGLQAVDEGLLLGCAVQLLREEACLRLTKMSSPRYTNLEREGREGGGRKEGKGVYINSPAVW